MSESIAEKWTKEECKAVANFQAAVLARKSGPWLRNHKCAWCGQTLWHALLHGCGPIFPADCDLAKRPGVAS